MKNSSEYHILHMCVKNHDQMMYFSEMQTDGQKVEKKRHMEVGAPPKKIYIFINIFGNKTISITILEVLLLPATSYVFSISYT